MNNIALERIKSQSKDFVKTPIAFGGAVKIVENPAIKPEDLKKFLEEELLKENKIQNINIFTDNKNQDFSLKKWDNLYDFVLWYSGKRDLFSDKQKSALDTLVQARDLINKGCACRKRQREEVSFAYYRDFWEKNKSTDLLFTVKKVAGTSKIELFSDIYYPKD